MGRIKERNCTEAWWAELEEIEEKTRELNWCCKLIVEAGFEEFIQNEVGIFVSLRFGVNYCPHCGTLLRENLPLINSRTCCYLFRDLGLEALQYEENVVNDRGEREVVIHRLMMKHCFNCGRIMKWDSDDDPGGWAGDGGSSCGECDEC